MMAELGWKMTRMQNGGIRLKVTSVSKPVGKLLVNKREYYNRFIRQLKAAGEFKDIWIEIDSTGGSLASACGMIQALGIAGWKKHNMRILINGRCDSAATMLLKLPFPVYITPTSGMYIHMPSSVKYKRKNDGCGYFQTGITRMDKEASVGAMEGAYIHRCKSNGKKKKRREIRAMMEESRRFSPAEAVEYGLADAIMTATEFERSGLF